MRDYAGIIGVKVRRLRNEQHWRQRDLARKAALPARTVGRIERGEVDVRLSTLIKIAGAFGVNPKRLLP